MAQEVVMYPWQPKIISRVKPTKSRKKVIICAWEGCKTEINDISCKNRVPKYCEHHRKHKIQIRQRKYQKNHYKPSAEMQFRKFMRLLDMVKHCRICSSPVPKGRRTICSDKCDKKNRSKMAMKCFRKKRQSRNTT